MILRGQVNYVFVFPLMDHAANRRLIEIDEFPIENVLVLNWNGNAFNLERDVPNKI